MPATLVPFVVATVVTVGVTTENANGDADDARFDADVSD